MTAVLLLFAGAGLLVTLWALVKCRRRMRAISESRVEREGKLPAGRLLELALGGEFLTFHDVPTDDATIDHVAVGPSGVYAIESRRWPPAPLAAERAGREIRFDGKRLYFPGDAGEGDSRILAAARRKAQWLQEWIALAAGEYVAVQPVVLLAGWQIRVASSAQPIETSTVRVLNEGELARLQEGPRIVQPTAVHRIAAQLERRGRDTCANGRAREQGVRRVVADPQSRQAAPGQGRGVHFRRRDP